MAKNIVKPIMFMMHIAFKNIDDVAAELEKKHSLGDYVIAYEDKPYEHMHFIVHMTENDYLAFSSLMKRKYKLRTKATQGLRRQIGRVKQIRDIKRGYQYTVKENKPEWLRTNMSKEQIDDYIELSFKKENGEPIRDWLVENPPYNFNDLGHMTSEMDYYPPHEPKYYGEQQFKEQMRIYFVKMFQAIGHQEKMKYHFYRIIYELKYINAYDYCMLVYKI